VTTSLAKAVFGYNCHGNIESVILVTRDMRDFASRYGMYAQLDGSHGSSRHLRSGLFLPRLERSYLAITLTHPGGNA
jgi:hypothetical protein